MLTYYKANQCRLWNQKHVPYASYPEAVAFEVLPLPISYFTAQCGEPCKYSDALVSILSPLLFCIHLEIKYIVTHVRKPLGLLEQRCRLM
jgi:hypothetical protein